MLKLKTVLKEAIHFFVNFSYCITLKLLNRCLYLITSKDAELLRKKKPISINLALY